jgi:hypothetical protein
MHGRAMGRATPACTGPHSSTQVAVGWQGVPDADLAQAYRQQHMAVYTKTVLPPPLDKQVIVSAPQLPSSPAPQRPVRATSCLPQRPLLLHRT